MQHIDKIYINGEFVTPHGSEIMDLFSPVSNEKVADVRLADEMDTRKAIAAAKEALKTFSQTSKEERIGYLEKLHAALKAREQDLIDVMVDEYGGASAFVEMIMPYSIDDFKEMAGVVKDFDFEPKAGHSKVRLQAAGVVGIIIPWNMSNGFICTKVASAIGAGCTVVIKPAELSAQQTQVMMECIHAAGIPKGVVNILHGTGPVVGNELTVNPDVNKISFTGSTATGKHIARVAADRLTRVTLELGGKNPAIVLKDANPEWVIEGLMTGSFLNQGQVCAASSRIYIEAPLFDTLVSGFEQAVKSMSVGPGMLETTQINPVVSKAHCAKVAAYLDEARQQKAELISGNVGPDAQGFYIPPTLVINPDANLRLTREEVFGPVVNLVRVANGEEALQLANDSEYGLTASVWTQNISKALEYTDRLQAGTVWVNSHTLIDANLPFGGMKQSGTGRDFGPDWLDGWCETKSVCVRY